MKKLWFTLAAALVLGACNWQVPEEVTFRANPQVYIPTGAALFELDFIDDFIDDFEEDSGEDFDEVGEKKGVRDPRADDVTYDGQPLTLFAELNIGVPTFDSPVPPEFGDELVVGEGETDELDFSEVFGPIPDSVEISELPAWIWFSATDPANPPDVDVRIEAQWNWDNGTPAETMYLMGELAAEPLAAAFDADVHSFDLAAVINQQPRPEDLVLRYEFGTTAGEVNSIGSIHLRIEIPFRFETTERTFLDPSDDDDPEDNPLVMDDDIFDRDPAEPDEDLDDFLEAIRGSSAAIVLQLENSSGFGARLGMINSLAAPVDEAGYQAYIEDPSNWVIDVELDSVVGEQDVVLDISPAALDKMIDGIPVGPHQVSQFIPEFLIELPYDDDSENADNTFQINRDGAFDVMQGYLRVRAKFDHTFSIGNDD